MRLRALLLRASIGEKVGPSHAWRCGGWRCRDAVPPPAPPLTPSCGPGAPDAQFLLLSVSDSHSAKAFWAACGFAVPTRSRGVAVCNAAAKAYGVPGTAAWAAELQDDEVRCSRQAGTHACSGGACRYLPVCVRAARACTLPWAHARQHGGGTAAGLGRRVHCSLGLCCLGGNARQHATTLHVYCCISSVTSPDCAVVVVTHYDYCGHGCAAAHSAHSCHPPGPGC